MFEKKQDKTEARHIIVYNVQYILYEIIERSNWICSECLMPENGVADSVKMCWNKVIDGNKV